MSTELRDLLCCPVVVAPMAGGPSTPGLVVAVTAAGALGFLAAGYKSAEAMAEEVAAVRAATTLPFGVNVFVPGTEANDREPVDRYMRSLAGEAEVLGADLGTPSWDDDHFDPKVDLLLANPPALVGFTFGCPSSDVVDAFHGAGALVAITVTSPDEAGLAAAAGVDALCVQGIEAGAHRGAFINDATALTGLGVLDLVRAVARVTELPQIAAGGIMGGSGVQAVLSAGAVAAQCGTAFLRCPESGAHPLYKAALSDPRFTSTEHTRAFSGRPARGLVNQFMVNHRDAPAAYPEINNATRLLRSAAAAAGDADRMSLWAGVGFREATERPAGEVVELLHPLDL
jgi:nitronate monooxygenase